MRVLILRPSVCLQIRGHPWYVQPPAPAFSEATVQLALEQRQLEQRAGAQVFDQVTEGSQHSRWSTHTMLIRPMSQGLKWRAGQKAQPHRHGHLLCEVSTCRLLSQDAQQLALTNMAPTLPHPWMLCRRRRQRVQHASRI